MLLYQMNHSQSSYTKLNMGKENIIELVNHTIAQLTQERTVLMRCITLQRITNCTYGTHYTHPLLRQPPHSWEYLMFVDNFLTILFNVIVNLDNGFCANVVLSLVFIVSIMIVQLVPLWYLMVLFFVEPIIFAGSNL